MKRWGLNWAVKRENEIMEHRGQKWQPWKLRGWQGNVSASASLKVWEMNIQEECKVQHFKKNKTLSSFCYFSPRVFWWWMLINPKYATGDWSSPKSSSHSTFNVALFKIHNILLLLVFSVYLLGSFSFFWSSLPSVMSQFSLKYLLFSPPTCPHFIPLNRPFQT